MPEGEWVATPSPPFPPSCMVRIWAMGEQRGGGEKTPGSPSPHPPPPLCGQDRGAMGEELGDGRGDGRGWERGDGTPLSSSTAGAGVFRTSTILSFPPESGRRWSMAPQVLSVRVIRDRNCAFLHMDSVGAAMCVRAFAQTTASPIILGLNLHA